LRRGVRAAEKVAELTIGATQIDFARRLTHGPSGEVHLTPLEFRALECLARHLGSVVTQSQLIREVWGPQRVADTRSLRVCIKHLREKLEPDPGKPQYLLTETGVGSRLRGEENPELTSARER